MRTSIVATALGLLASCGGREPRCPPVPSAPAQRTCPVAASGGRFLDGEELDRVLGTPDLAARLRARPYAYYRLIADTFAQRVCDEFCDLLQEMPRVNLHADAHVEQYSVTDSAFGLDDFDRSGSGAAVVDVVRFAASLHVACTETTFECDGKRAIEAFLTAYARGLSAPDTPAEAPAVVARMRAATPDAAPARLAWAESLMTPVTADTDARVRARWKELQAIAPVTDPSRAASEYDIVKFGGLSLGLGSALEVKFLFRLAGPTSAPDDDLIVEVKRVRALEASCVYHPPSGGMLMQLLPALRIGRARPAVLSYVPPSRIGRGDQHLWVRSWDPGYRELKISDLRSQTELEQVAADVGLQLGRGHCVALAAPLEAQHRIAALRAFENARPRVEPLARKLADQAIAEWRALARP